MGRLFTAIMVLLIMAGTVFSRTGIEREAEFFAGLTLLQLKTDLKPEEKALKFRELEALSGITTAEAKTILRRYREKPAEWQLLDGEMMKLLNDTKRLAQKNDSIKNAAKDTVRAIVPDRKKKTSSAKTKK